MTRRVVTLACRCSGAYFVLALAPGATLTDIADLTEEFDAQHEGCTSRTSFSTRGVPADAFAVRPDDPGSRNPSRAGVRKRRVIGGSACEPAERRRSSG